MRSEQRKARKHVFFEKKKQKTFGCLAAALLISAAGPKYGVGRNPTDAEIGAWNIDVAPDGAGLPTGRGSVEQGAKIFAARCAVCHGADGQAGNGAPVAKLVGGAGTLASAKPVKTVGSYWPYATTLYDYIHRAMPLGNAQSLAPDDVYAVTAYVLNLNGILPAGSVLDAASLAAVKMPNRNGFFATPHEP
jgi:cytochrome c